MERRLLSVAAHIVQTFDMQGRPGACPAVFVRMRTPFAVRDISRFPTNLVA
jgi:hypothetical protein